MYVVTGTDGTIIIWKHVGPKRSSDLNQARFSLFLMSSRAHSFVILYFTLSDKVNKVNKTYP